MAEPALLFPWPPTSQVLHAMLGSLWATAQPWGGPLLLLLLLLHLLLLVICCLLHNQDLPALLLLLMFRGFGCCACWRQW